jgi:hypothetical protein
MRKLKAVLCPIGALGRQTDRDVTVGVAFEIGLRMVPSIINPDSRKPRTWAGLQHFAHRGLQDGTDIGAANLPEPSGLHIDIEPLRSGATFRSRRFARSNTKQRYEPRPRQLKYHVALVDELFRT